MRRDGGTDRWTDMTKIIGVFHDFAKALEKHFLTLKRLLVSLPQMFTVLLLVNDQLDALFINVFISCLCMFRATSAHHQEDQVLLIHHLA